MRIIVVVLIVASLGGADAQTRMSSERLLSWLTELQTLDTADGEVAANIAKVALTTRLPADAVSLIQRSDYGPMTVSALQLLASASANLPVGVGPTASVTSPPDSQQAKEMFNRVARYASTYVGALPRFVCLETTRYFTSSHWPTWKLDQTVIEEVRYRDGAEEYLTKLVNDKPSNEPLADVRNSYSRGEFGTILGQTFDPASQAKFDWDHWESAGEMKIGVWRFSVGREHSLYRVCCISAGSVTIRGVRRQKRETWASAYRGFLYAEAETGVIRRFTFHNVDIPSGYNLEDARNLLDFDRVTLGAGQVWLPVRAIHYARQGKFRTRSEIAFSNFRSFQADSTIQFPGEGSTADPKQ